MSDKGPPGRSAPDGCLSSFAPATSPVNDRGGVTSGAAIAAGGGPPPLTQDQRGEADGDRGEDVGGPTSRARMEGMRRLWSFSASGAARGPPSWSGQRQPCGWNPLDAPASSPISLLTTHSEAATVFCKTIWSCERTVRKEGAECSSRTAYVGGYGRSTCKALPRCGGAPKRGEPHKRLIQSGRP